MSLWTMAPDGQRVLVVPAHRAYAAAMTEDDPLIPEDSERLRAALRERDRSMGHAVHYCPGDVPFAARNLWGCTGAMSPSPWPGATNA